MSEQTTRPTKRLGQLVRGDFVHYNRTTDAETGTVCEVKAVLPYRDGDGRERVSGLLLPLSGGEPRHVRKFATYEFVMATEDDVVEARDQARRHQLQDDLVALQGLLSGLNIRPSAYHGGGWNIAVVDGEVSRIAEALSLPLTEFGSGANRVVEWTAPGGEDFGQRVQVRFWGKPAEKPEPVEVHEPSVDETPEADQPWHFTFGSGLLYDGRYVVITGTYASARERMLEVFGRAWCAQYSPASFSAEFKPGVLVELPESEWPPVVADEDCADPWHEQPVEPTEPCPACGEHAFPVQAANDAPSGR